MIVNPDADVSNETQYHRKTLQKTSEERKR